MKVFEIIDMYPSTCMEIVYELRQDGCKQGSDFDFKYIPPTFNWAQDEGTPRRCVFTFYTDKWATWFAMKYV